MAKLEAIKSVAVGDVLAGKYRVEKILGMGGMGIVVAAMHLDLREMRAIKLIRPDARNDQSIERFLREARAVVRLRSEHVAEVYDVGRLESGAPYIVMELLEGQDLSAILKARGPLPVDEAVLYVTQACHALAEAHAAGIVHRDLKPGNLFRTHRADGSVCIKVLDFGISKNTKMEQFDPEMTGAKDIVGSPMYMSPEQMRSARKVDPRADVWALGAILYKLLTGRPPFHAPTVPEIFALTLGKQVRPPSALRPEIPNELERIILCCLDKTLHHRYATAAELGAELVPHGPWEGANVEAPMQLFARTRRTSVPPAPLSTNIDADEPEQRLSEPPLTVQGIDASDPMMGLARSHKIVRSGPIPTWSASRIVHPPRPAWLGLVVILSILSALIGASVVLIFVRTAGTMVANQPPEKTTGSELHAPSAFVIPAPSAALAQRIDVNASANSAPTAPPVLCSAPKDTQKWQEPKRALPTSTVDIAARPLPTWRKRVPVRVPAKPENAHATPQDPIPYRE